MKRILAILIFGLVLGVAIFWWMRGSAPVNPQDKNSKYFVIQRGAGVHAIANDLKSQGLINDPTFFYLYVKLNGSERNIKAGDFKLSPSMNISQIVNQLLHGPVDAWITIPEGYRAQQIADVLEAQIPSFRPSWRTVLNEKEGYLFPDTYLIPRDSTIDQILLVFQKNFDKKIQEAGLSNRSDLDRIIIIASLIEREALFHDERATVASVIYNRLNLGMKLDIDATVQYALGKRNGKWWYPVNSSDLKINSIYNTYTNNGLPPGPISNPGLNSIKAAVNPASTNYLYYLTDSKGHVHGAATFQEHQTNIRKYLQ